MALTVSPNPPRIYSTSRQLIGGDDFNNLNAHSFSSQTVTATGTVIGTAAQLNAANVEILAGSANNAGVALPAAFPGAEVAILNNSANTTLVYPINNGVDVIQNGTTGFGAAGASVSMATGVNSLYFCIKKGFWQVTKTTGP